MCTAYTGATQPRAYPHPHGATNHKPRRRHAVYTQTQLAAGMCAESSVLSRRGKSAQRGCRAPIDHRFD
eukprot:scaffold21923_cov112-Isochrysis_galbana.AAC.2